MLESKLDTKLNPLAVQVTSLQGHMTSLQSHVTFIGESVETLGTQVEHLEALNQGKEFEGDDESEEEEEGNEGLASVQLDAGQTTAHDNATRPRLTRRSAQAVLANHGNGLAKKKKAG